MSEKWNLKMEDRRKEAKGREIWVIKAGFPDNEKKIWWSEYAFSRSLKKYLERLGYYVVIESYEEWQEQNAADVVVVLRGHKEYFPDRSNKDCLYIMWNLSHPATITEEEYNAYDLVCVGSQIQISKIQKVVHVPIKYLPICADTELFYPDEKGTEKKEYDWIFVGNSRFVKRKSVMWSIAHGIPLKIWGANWENILPDSKNYVEAVNIPNDDLPDLYRNAKMTVDDHYEDMIESGFINTRMVESIACGLPIISDYSKTFEELFGDAILYYCNEAEFVEQTKVMQEQYEEIHKKILSLWPVIKEEYSFESCSRHLKKWADELKVYRGQLNKDFQAMLIFDESSVKIRQERKVIYDKKPKVSVILPVYNMEAYLADCIESIQNQTLQDLEIIGIDDGSSDHSLGLLLKYAEMDDRISVYSQQNTGLSVVRNRGMDLAAGEYLYFMDSDDWLETDALEKCYEQCQKDQLDILIFNGKTEYEHEIDRKSHPEYEHFYERNSRYPNVCSGEEMLVKMRKAKEYKTSVVMKFYNSSFLKETGCKFIPGVFHEDNDFTFRTMLLAKCVGYCKNAYYHRRVHGSSIMTTKNGIAHVYGYYRNFRSMEAFALEYPFDFETSEMIYDVLKGVLSNIKTNYESLTFLEQTVFWNLEPIDRMKFEFCIQSVNGGGLFQKIYLEKLNLQRKLQQTYAEKSEINRKLQQTYAEKSEINRKLQITYQEKYERGLEIKKLKKKIKTIKASKTYCLARFIGIPIRFFRKIQHKRS